jgi:hypothetical protein
MRAIWLVPAGLMVLGAAAVARRSRRRPLGRTARRGVRTGEVEVDPGVVRARVERLVKQMVACGSRGGVQPVTDGAAPPVDVTDAATGETRKVRVLMRPRSLGPGNVGGGWLVTSVGEAGDLRQDVILSPNKNACASPDFWDEYMGDVLHHELAHASDPAIVLEARGRRKHRPTQTGSRSYYNSPAEMTAQVAEVARQLRRAAFRMALDGRDGLSPSEFLRAGSPKFVSMEPYLTESNKRRFLRLAARLQQRA